MPSLHGSRAFTTTYATSSGSLSLGLSTSLPRHHQRTGRLQFAFSQVQSQNPSLDVGYNQKAQRVPHQCLFTEMCQVCCFPHGAVDLAVLQSMLPQPNIQT